MATLNIKAFPDSLYDSIRARASSEHRSIAQEVIHLLSQAVREAESSSILSLQGLGKELWQGIDAVAHVDDERSSWD